MSDLGAYLWLIPTLPLLGSVVIGFFGPRFLRQHSHWPCILGIVLSCLLSAFVFANVWQGGKAIQHYYTWFQTVEPFDTGDVTVGFALRADGLTAMMLMTVTFIGSLIAIYSVGYMHHDPGYPRFFAAVALFIFNMTGLVLADNYFLLYAFWEGVGLCSYLLIGFWFTKPSAAAAARKAFLVTRLGDVGFFLGILLLWANCDYSVNYDQVFERVKELSPNTITWICILLFSGAVGKSAQFPLHVWLPDAMEGPTPVSALIHAATMVTAGVYLVARSTPLFVLSPDAQLLVAVLGGITAFLAALIALTQNDLKRVLAYSTLSQLGYMFLALGSGLDKDLVVAAVIAAVFHLFTHAFFKALLFLAAGSVMHSMGGVIDMRRFSGLRYVMPSTHWTFLCGAAALAGVPLLSGFWSKDEILGAALHAAGAEGNPYAGVYAGLFFIGLVTAGLTAFYTFRAYFMTFWGDLRVPHEAGEHAHESPPVMTVPLMILAVFALGVGIIVEPFTHWFSGLVSQTEGLHHVHEHTMNLLLMGGSAVVALGGVALAWWMYVAQPGFADRLASAFQIFYQLSLNKFYLDELYGFFFVGPIVVLAHLNWMLDFLVDGIVDFVGQVPSRVGGVLRPVQNGLVQYYALGMALAAAVFLIVLNWR